MKFEDAVEHLTALRLEVVMPDGRLHPASRKLRKPRGFVPVRVLDRGGLPKSLRKMIRRSRAEARNSHPSSKHD